MCLRHVWHLLGLPKQLCSEHIHLLRALRGSREWDWCSALLSSDLKVSSTLPCVIHGLFSEHCAVIISKAAVLHKPHLQSANSYTVQRRNSSDYLPYFIGEELERVNFPRPHRWEESACLLGLRSQTPSCRCFLLHWAVS